MGKEKVAPMKQVVLYAIINYMGTVIGIVSALFIYPEDYGFLGTVRYVDNIWQLLYPIMVLGASQALIKFYPALQEHYRKQLFNYSLISVFIISILVLAGIFIYNIGLKSEDSYLLYFAFPIAVSMAYVELFKKQAQDLQKIAVPTLYEKIFPKVALPVIFLLLLRNILTEDTSLLWYAVSYAVIFVLTAIYLFKRFNPGFNYRFKTLFGQISRKDYFRYSLYSFAGSLGSLLAFRIDGIIIFNMISEEANGVFSNAVTLASTLQIPAIGMFALYAPIISTYLKNGNFKDLDIKYKEIARLLFFIGAVLYSCIFLGIEDLFRILPAYEKLKDTIPVIIVLGFSVLINMATGFNGEIITYSKYYRFNLVAILVLIFLNVSLNLYFIYYTDTGIMGVAYASFVSMTLFNISKLLFIYKKFGLLPFDKSFAKLALIFAISGTAIYFLPDFESHIINLIYKTGLSILINVVAVYKLRLVYQVNVWADMALAKIRG
ncbi:oligosaccharide flippase family protein [Flavobacterium zepuense]|uniref:Oligosaccharide flippase family protein n=1 Tax=Flavobacterium zepuense TaxID=2593302 RepID=A0A552V4C8_9FLAO|nr:oligosaccharide flippase family protein [Flavobacterium zepuense]TRW25311.1 oligosaccharide flippase family protein [Flavobacterium zepuense]